MHHLLLIAALIFHLTCFSQIDPRRLDSLSRVIDSANKNMQAWQDSFNKQQDSIYQSNTGQVANGNKTKTSDTSKKHQQKNKWPIILSLVTGFVLFLLLFFKLKNRKKDHG